MIGLDADGRPRLHSHCPAGCLSSHLMLHHVSGVRWPAPTAAAWRSTPPLSMSARRAATVHSYKYTTAATAAPSTLPCRSIMVRCTNGDMLQLATVRVAAHSMLLCPALAAVQMRDWCNLVQALALTAGATLSASCARHACRVEGRIDHTELAERTSHASVDAIEPLLLRAHPFLARSDRMRRSGRRRGASDGSRHVRQ